MIGPLLHGLHRGGHGGEPGDHDDFGVRGQFLGALQHLQAVHLLHLQVGHDQIEFLFFQFLEGQDAAFHRHGVIPFLLEHMVQVFPGDHFIFDDENLAPSHDAALSALTSGL